MTYLITFSCYGSHLHGHDLGSVDRNHRVPGSRLLEANPERVGGSCGGWISRRILSITIAERLCWRLSGKFAGIAGGFFTRRMSARLTCTLSWRPRIGGRRS